MRRKVVQPWDSGPRRRSKYLATVDWATSKPSLSRAPSTRDVLLVEHAAGDDGAVEAGILGDLADRRLQGAAYDLDADLLVVVGALLVLEHTGGIEQRRTAAGDDAFLDRGHGDTNGETKRRRLRRIAPS